LLNDVESILSNGNSDLVFRFSAGSRGASAGSAHIAATRERRYRNCIQHQTDLGCSHRRDQLRHQFRHYKSTPISGREPSKFVIPTDDRTYWRNAVLVVGDGTQCQWPDNGGPVEFYCRRFINLKFVEFADKASGESEGLHLILNNPEPDFRMRDAELLVRYFAFRNFLEDYRGNLRLFLDETCSRLNKDWNNREVEIKTQLSEFEKAIRATYEIFGENAFRKWDGHRYEGRFNRAVFDVMIYYFSSLRIRSRALMAKPAIEKEFKKLCQSDPVFLKSIESTTKSLDATINRLRIWGAALRHKLRISIPVPERVGNQINL
jgi:hypothetical protein